MSVFHDLPNRLSRQIDEWADMKLTSRTGGQICDLVKCYGAAQGLKDVQGKLLQLTFKFVKSCLMIKP